MHLIAVAAMFTYLALNHYYFYPNVCVFPLASHFACAFIGSLWWVTITSGIYVTIWEPAYPAIKVGLVITLLSGWCLAIWDRISHTLAHTPQHVGQPSRFSSIVASVILCAILLSWLGYRKQQATRNAASRLWWLLVIASRPPMICWPYAWQGLRSLLFVPVWLATWLIPFVFTTMLDETIRWFVECSKDTSTRTVETIRGTEPVGGLQSPGGFQSPRDVQ